jgi:hypothetical protein
LCGSADAQAAAGKAIKQRDKAKQDLVVAKSNVSKLASEGGTLPVLLSRATSELEGIRNVLATRVEIPDHVNASITKFDSIVDALSGFEEVVRGACVVVCKVEWRTVSPLPSVIRAFVECEAVEKRFSTHRKRVRRVSRLA